MDNVVNLDAWRRGVRELKPNEQAIEAIVYLDDIPLFTVDLDVHPDSNGEDIEDAIRLAILDELNWQWELKDED